MEQRIGLFVDWIATPKEIPPNISSWQIIRTYEEFKQWFTDNHFIPKMISFNFELSEEYMRYTLSNPIGTPIIYETLGNGSGASCAVFLKHLCDKNNLKLNKVCVHGDRNNRGCIEIQKFINSWKEEQDCFMAEFEIYEPSGENYEKFLKIKEEVDAELSEKGLI